MTNPSPCKVKICGITNLADARYASGAGADFLGFIQHEESPRFVEPKLAKDIIVWLYGAKTVGVFVNKRSDEVNRISDMAGFDYVKLHGDESPEYCEWIDRPIIKVLRVQPGWTADHIQEAAAPYLELAEYFLLDTHSPSEYGGTGDAFDWTILEYLDLGLPFFLAGGLNPENVESAIQLASPYAIDVSSGIESAPGQKDFDKIDAFMETALEAGGSDL